MRRETATGNLTYTLMRILDRYVLKTFLKNYLISLMVLVGMYIVLDMVFNFGDLVDVKSNEQASVQSSWGPSATSRIIIPTSSS